MPVYCFGDILASGNQLPTIYTRCSPFVKESDKRKDKLGLRLPHL